MALLKRNGALTVHLRAALVVLAILGLLVARAQTLVSNAKGESAVQFPGSVFTFDIQEAAIGFNYTQIGNKAGYGDGMLLGVQASGKPTDGIAPIVSGGDLSPDAKLGGVVGYSWSDRSVALQDRLDSITKDISRSDSLFVDSVHWVLRSWADGVALSDPQREGFERYLNDSMKHVSEERFKKQVERLAARMPDHKDGLTALGSELAKRYAAHRRTKSKLEDERTRTTRMQESNRIRERFLVYADGGIRALQFKRFGQLDTVDLSKSFYDQEFQGGELRLGFNYNCGARLLFGGAYGVRRAENLATLKKADHTLTTVNSNATQQLKSEQKITAYRGDFQAYTEKTLYLDLVYFAKVSDSALVAFNVYGRWMNSAKEEVMPDRYDLGCALNFFKPRTGAFSGGIYLESQDVGNAVGKKLALESEDPAKALADLDPYYKRLTFGLVAKLSIGTFAKFRP